MCLIVCKPKGIPLPGRKKLKQWFASYPDGVGIAFQYRDKVRILKGAMTDKEMFALIARMEKLLCPKKPKDIDIVIQFRQAVTGSVCPKYCHPFPVTSSQEELDSLDVLADCALAHNGIIHEYSTRRNGCTLKAANDVNDAQEFIKDYLAGMGGSLWNPFVQRLIQSYTASKFALLTSTGIVYIGEFIADQGILYSNEGYIGAKLIATALYPLTPALHFNYDEGFGVCQACQTYSKALFTPAWDETPLCADCFRQYAQCEPTKANLY